MLKVVGNEAVEDEVDGRSLLDEIAREGASRMLVAAVETEVVVYLEAHRDERDAEGHALVVRNGKGRTRKVTVGSGTIPVSAPPRERPANRPRRRAPPIHEPHPAALHAPLPEGGRGVAGPLPAGAVHR
jgi:hypothetical protein